MTYLSLSFNLILAMGIVVLYVSNERRRDKDRAIAIKRENSLLNRIPGIDHTLPDPLPEAEEKTPYIPVDDSPFADAQWDLHVLEGGLGEDAS